jgi:hypothetical protein
MTELDFLSDSTEQTTTRYVTFISPSLNRFDLAVMTTNSFYGKKLVIDMKRGISAIVGPDDLEEEGYFEHVFKLKPQEAEDLLDFLQEVIGPISYPE